MRPVTVRQIDVGSSSIVYVTENGTALKVYHGTSAHDESHWLARMDHPSIVSMLSYGEDEKGAWLEMPMALGNAEKHPSARRPQALQQIVEVLGQGLEHIHSRGVHHNDVRRKNILAWGDSFQLADLGNTGVAGSVQRDLKAASMVVWDVWERVRGRRSTGLRSVINADWRTAREWQRAMLKETA